MRPTPQSVITEKNKLENKPIRLFIIDGGPLGAEILRYAAYPQNVVYPTSGGQTYYRAPIIVEERKENALGQPESMKISISSVDQSIIWYLQQKDGLRGCRMVERIVWENLLNDPDAYQDSILWINECDLDDQNASFKLVSKLNLQGIKLPRRRFLRLTCQWKFKSSRCGYSGGQTACNHTIQRCLELNNRIRFGGFPGTGAALRQIWIGS